MYGLLRFQMSMVYRHGQAVLMISPSPLILADISETLAIWALMDFLYFRIFWERRMISEYLLYAMQLKASDMSEAFPIGEKSIGKD